MESDSRDAWHAFSNRQKQKQNPLVVELQETLTEPFDKFELLLPALQTSLSELRNIPIQIRTGLRSWWELLDKTRCFLEDTQNRVLYPVSMKSWVADLMEVLNDMEDILDEIMDANRYRLTAEDQSSANNPWKLIPNLFNKVSRFMHDPDKEMASKVLDITDRFQLILEEANVLDLIEELDTEDIERLATEDKAGLSEPKNLGRKQFAMLNAIRKGKFWKVRGFFVDNPDAFLSTTIENGQTALHVAITAGQQKIAKELIASISTENRHLLKIGDNSGNTALSFAARSGMMEIANCLIEKNEDLLTIPDANNKMPIQLACSAGHEDMTRFLFRCTPPKFLDGDRGFCFLEECITKKMFGIALHLLHYFPKFATYRLIKDGHPSIILTLARTPPPFFRGNQLAFWRQWIYNCIRVKIDKRRVPSDGVNMSEDR